MTPGEVGKPYSTSAVYEAAFKKMRAPYPNLLLQTNAPTLPFVGAIKALKGQFNLRSKLNTEYTLPTKLDGWQIPQEPTITISGGKNIVETELNRGERKQNVLEEINLNNYQLIIRGVILNETNFDSYPEEDVRRLREILEKAGSVTIENGLTSIWNISKVAIVRWEMFEVKGYIGAQAFELECKSDEDFELELVDEPEQL